MLKILLCAFSFFYGVASCAMVRQTDSFIRLRAPYRSLCGGVIFTIKKDIPYDTGNIMCVGYKYDPAAKEMERKGSCLLEQLPKEGIKFDCPSYKKNIHYRIYFVLTSDNGAQEKIISPAKIIEKIVTIPAKLCATVSLPYKPLNLSQSFTQGEIIGATAIGTAVVGTALYKAYQRHKQFNRRVVEGAKSALQWWDTHQLEDALDRENRESKRSPAQFEALKELYYERMFDAAKKQFADGILKTQELDVELKEYASGYLFTTKQRYKGYLEHAQKGKNQSLVIERKAFVDAADQLLQDVNKWHKQELGQKLYAIAPEAS